MCEIMVDVVWSIDVALLMRQECGIYMPLYELKGRGRTIGKLNNEV